MANDEIDVQDAQDILLQEEDSSYRWMGIELGTVVFGDGRVYFSLVNPEGRRRLVEMTPFGISEPSSDIFIPWDTLTAMLDDALELVPYGLPIPA